MLAARSLVGSMPLRAGYWKKLQDAFAYDGSAAGTVCRERIALALWADRAMLVA